MIFLLLAVSLSGEAQTVSGRLQPTPEDRQAAAAIAAAVALLPRDLRPTVPVVVLNPKVVTRVLLKQSAGACAFVLNPRRNVIFFRMNCAALEEAMRTRDTVALRAVAVLLAHEQAHVRGATECEARAAQNAAFERVTSVLSPAERVTALDWFAAFASARNCSVS